MFNRQWIKLRKALKESVRTRSPFLEVSSLLTALWSEKPALFSAVWYSFKARNTEHPDQVCMAKTSLWDTRDMNQDLLGWRRKLSSILSHPRGVPLLPNNHLENGWGCTDAEEVFEKKKCLRSCCSAQISVQRVCITLVQHVLLHWVSKESRQKRQKVDCFVFLQSKVFCLC